MSSSIGSDSSGAQMIVSSVGDYGSQFLGVYLVELTGRGTYSDSTSRNIKVTCLSRPTTNEGVVKFWKYLGDDSLVHFGFTSPQYSHGASFLVLNNDNFNLGLLKRNLTEPPASNLIEVSMVVLPQS